jgi:hypothetical protein
MTVAFRFVSLRLLDHPLITQAYAQGEHAEKAEIAAAKLLVLNFFVLSGY